MKTIKILLTATLILSTYTMKAQNYYTSNKDIIVNETTYRVKTDLERAHFHNAKIQYIDAVPIYRDGSRINWYAGLNPFKESDNPDEDLENSMALDYAIMTFLTPAEKAQIKRDKEDIFVHIYIDTDTGQPIGVDFLIPRTGTYTSIPPERYYQLEKKLLELAKKIELSPEGRKRNFVVFPTVLHSIFIE